MLLELHIKNAAIFERQAVSFGPGLTVLSGETGSGKSIILNSIEFLLGAKPKPHFLREGCDELEVQALFDLSLIPEHVRSELPEIAQGEQLAISRSLNAASKSKIFINGRLATLSSLTEVAGKLVSICGQHQHVRLLEPAYHLALLDGFAQNETALSSYREVFRQWHSLKIKLDEYANRERVQALRKAELEFLVDELTKVDIAPGLRQKLDAESKKLSRVADVVAGVSQIVDSIEGESGTAESLGVAASRLAELSKHDAFVEPFARRCRELRTQALELADEIRSYAAGLDTDPAALELVQERLAEVARLERKFKRTDSELAEMLQSATLELQGLSDLPDRKRLEADLLAAETEMKRRGEVLSKRRAEAAKKLSKQVEAELAELSMEARFMVQLEPMAWGEQGAEKVELLISANKGLKPLPLRQIASGGELSRITLVLKKILQERSGVNVLVFDEVDTGISGGVARAVGEKLKALSQNSQVICITHLPQVASLADRHILVEKRKGKGGFAQAREMDAEERVEEIARMLAGYEVTAAARASARELVSSKIS